MTFNSGQGTELAAQHQSTGILYQGYEKDFHLCIFEEPNVQGRNERYEFRCDTSLECCGRVCCTPEVAAIPLWLWLLFLILGLLALLALLSLLAYWCARRKRKQKKEKFVPSPLHEKLLAKPQAVQVIQHNDGGMGKAQVLPEPVPVPSPTPLKARHAIYRPFVPDNLEETDLPPESVLRASQHDLSQVLGQPKRPTVSTLESPQQQNAEFMYTKPGFDSVPSY